MELQLNRTIFAGLAIAGLTACTALAGAPAGFAGFRLPIWELLLQLNLCSGFVFLIVGVLQTTETPLPDLRPSLQLLGAAFVAYAITCAGAAATQAIPFAAQLFLFALALACLGAGWARFVFSLLRMLDAVE